MAKLKERKGNLGTFAGVFTPSILTILGIILFLRLGYVVGSAGLARALMMIALANAISVLTTVSLSAIATNLKVKGGGDYYLISRTLGVSFGLSTSWQWSIRGEGSKGSVMSAPWPEGLRTRPSLPGMPPPVMWETAFSLTFSG